MPTTNNEVHFKHGLKANFNQATKNADTLYFATDTQELYLGDQRYCGNIGVGSTLPLTPYEGEMFILNQNGNYNLYICDGTDWYSTTALTEQQFAAYRQEVDNTIAAIQLVTEPFYIIDNQANKTYQAAFQIASDGTPQLKYEEFVVQSGGGE